MKVYRRIASMHRAVQFDAMTPHTEWGAEYGVSPMAWVTEAAAVGTLTEERLATETCGRMGTGYPETTEGIHHEDWIVLTEHADYVKKTIVGPEQFAKNFEYVSGEGSPPATHGDPEPGTQVPSDVNPVATENADADAGMTDERPSLPAR